MFFRNRTPATSGGIRASTSSAWAHLLASFALLLPAVAASSSDCGAEVLCITAVKEPAGTELRAVNQEAFPITLKFHLTPINMRRTGTEPAQWVLQPGQAVSLAKLRIDDPQQPWDYRYRTSWSRGDYRVEHDDSYVYGLPYLPGLGFPVSQSYNGEFSHHGDSRYAVDFEMPEGTPIVAAREGTVVSLRADSTVGGPSRKYEDDANYVVVQHADGTFAEYLHLQPNGIRVREGEQVRRGQLLGLSGNTGFSGGPHLHFMVAGATADGGRRSFPVRFQTGEGIVAELQTGHRYPYDAAPSVPGADMGAEGLAAASEEAADPAPAVRPAPGEPAVGSGQRTSAAGAGD
jgi:murein DD-endopeptidase MepM/ murein hydrolase activator NlpD